MAAEMGRVQKAGRPALKAATLKVNVGGLLRSLTRERESAAEAAAPLVTATVPGLDGLDKRCRQASQVVATRLSAAKPGTEQARYLQQLQKVLEAGARNPAAAVQGVRALSGRELSVVLAQLGVERQ
jgi:hypothetical protein